MLYLCQRHRDRVQFCNGVIINTENVSIVEDWQCFNLEKLGTTVGSVIANGITHNVDSLLHPSP